jgi:IS605 OrfB family transposase
MPIDEALKQGCIGVDTNHDHLAAWRLDPHGNPVGEPRRFPMDLVGSSDRRDAQIRHALAALLRWAKHAEVAAIAIEDLDFSAEKTREKFGRKREFRAMVNDFPVAKLKRRLVSMAAEAGISIVAVNAAYTSKWGAEHWQQPMSAPKRKTTRHDAASIVIGRRAQGFKARRRKSPPHGDRSDRRGHRSLQAAPEIREREGTRRRHRGSLPRAVTPQAVSMRETSVPKSARGTPVNSAPALFTVEELKSRVFLNRPQHPGSADGAVR